MIDGTELAAFGLTEPEAGSGSDALRTTAVAVAVEGGWRITGQKNSVSHLQAVAATHARQPDSTRRRA
jgi:alkylation response protein AidB-like acyl-CoA dehydrogenase